MRTSGWAVAALLCAGLVIGGCSPYRGRDPGEVGPGGSGPAASHAPTVPVVASVDATFAKRPAFGVTLNRPSEADVEQIATTTGCRPVLIQRFVSVADGVSLKTLRTTPGVPVVSLEPWHAGQGVNQPDFTLRDTVDGHWDTQYLKIAQSVVAYHDAVLIRFAHEMNGDWYPWGMVNGNTAADFVAAWRHVVQLFRTAGATNVLWVWSPNILSGARSTRISQFWPGDKYVDIAAMTGYGEHVSSPDQTFAATLKQIRALTTKPVLLAEVGVQADASKHRWLSAFGGWLRSHPQILGFVWFQNSDQRHDWRFDDTPTNLIVFKASLKTARVDCQS